MCRRATCENMRCDSVSDYNFINAINLMQNHRVTGSLAYRKDKIQQTLVRYAHRHRQTEKRRRMASLGRSICMQKRTVPIEPCPALARCVQNCVRDDSHFRVWFIRGKQQQSFLPDFTEFMQNIYTVINTWIRAPEQEGRSEKSKWRRWKGIRNIRICETLRFCAVPLNFEEMHICDCQTIYQCFASSRWFSAV